MTILRTSHALLLASLALALILFSMIGHPVYASSSAPVLVTIQETPSAASNSWGACFNYAGSSGQTCAGPGTPSASVEVPYGSQINYLCTANWDSLPNYNFASWSGAIPSSNPCITSGLSINVTSPLTIVANYAPIVTTTILYEPVTIEEGPQAAANSWGACFNYNGSSGQVCVGNGQASTTIQVPYGSDLDYLCTSNWGGSPAYNFYGWVENTNYWIPTLRYPASPCINYNYIVNITGPLTIQALYTATSSSTTTQSSTTTVSTTTTTSTTTVAYEQVTIQETPAAAATSWGACFNYAGSSGQTCAGPGTPSASVEVPYGSQINYLCTANWDSLPNYNFASWSGAIPSSNPCITSGLSINVTGPITLTADYASAPQAATTITSTPTTSTTTIVLNTPASTTNATTEPGTTITPLHVLMFADAVSPAGLASTSMVNSWVVASVGQPLTLSVSASGGTPPYNYRWFSTAATYDGGFENGNCTYMAYVQITGATSASYTAYPTVNTLYCVSITDSNNNLYDVAAWVTAVPSSKINIYPTWNGWQGPGYYMQGSTGLYPNFPHAYALFNLSWYFNSQAAYNRTFTTIPITITGNTWSWIGLRTAANGWQGSGFYAIYNYPNTTELGYNITSQNQYYTWLTNPNPTLYSLHGYQGPAYYTLKSSVTGMNSTVLIFNQSMYNNTLNLFGEVQNMKATLSVSSYTVQPGQAVTMTVNVIGGTPPFNYIWYTNPTGDSYIGQCLYQGYNETSQGGGATYVVHPTSTTRYCVKIYDNGMNNNSGDIYYLNTIINVSSTAKTAQAVTGDAVTSTITTATSTVYPTASTTAPLNASLSASSQTASQGQPVTLTVSAVGGTPPYSYHWFSTANSSTGSPSCNSNAYTLIPNTTSSSYTVNPSSTTTYCVSVSDISVDIYDTAATVLVTQAQTQAAPSNSQPASVVIGPSYFVSAPTPTTTIPVPVPKLIAQTASTAAPSTSTSTVLTTIPTPVNATVSTPSPQQYIYNNGKPTVDDVINGALGSATNYLSRLVQ